MIAVSTTLGALPAARRAWYEATTAIRQAEVTAAKRVIERTIDRFDLYPARLAGDSAYGSAEMLRWLVYEHGIEPHVTVFDKSA